MSEIVHKYSTNILWILRIIRGHGAHIFQADNDSRIITIKIDQHLLLCSKKRKRNESL